MALDKDGFPSIPAGQPGMAMMNGRARLFYPHETMAMLAGMLSSQLGQTVTDATSLQGKYDVGLYWVTGSRSAPPPPPPPDGGGSMPTAVLAESEAGPTLMQAVQDQLGLRLESKKGPVEFIVVDRMEKAPTEN
jgi:uncharacterized protein (TIGR03435 family)